MRRSVSILVFILVVTIAGPGFAQGPPGLDVRTLVAQALGVMGGGTPADSVATGSIDLVEGSLQQTGTIRILTRGSDESREEISTARGIRARVFSKGKASRIRDLDKESLSLELAATSQSPNFPLALLADAANDSDYAFEYIGLETWNESSVHHIRFWNTYASNPKLEHLAEFTEKDLWIDATSGLPVRIAYEERDGWGDVPSFHIEAHYSDYRDIGGVLYPFHIKRIYNGSPWAEITIDNVALNASVNDADFSVE